MAEVHDAFFEVRRLRTIHLHGDLACFGGPFCWDVSSPAEAVRGLCRQLPGIRQRLNEGCFHVVGGTLDDGFEHDEETLHILSIEDDIHFVPALEGAGSNNGFVKVILGAALIAASFIPVIGQTTFVIGAAKISLGATALSLGASIALTGVAQLLAPTPDLGSNESPDKRPSFLFNSGINRIEAGNPVPLAFGLFRVGSVVGSAGIAVEEVPLSSADGANSLKFLERVVPS